MAPRGPMRLPQKHLQHRHLPDFRNLQKIKIKRCLRCLCQSRWREAKWEHMSRSTSGKKGSWTKVTASRPRTSNFVLGTVARGSNLDQQLQQLCLLSRGVKNAGWLRNYQQQRVGWLRFHRRVGNNWYSEEKRTNDTASRATRKRLSKYDNVWHITAKSLMWQLKRKKKKEKKTTKASRTQRHQTVFHMLSKRQSRLPKC